MHGNHGLVDVRHAIAQHLDKAGELLRNGVTHRVGDVHRARAGLDGGLDAAAEEIAIGARGILRRPFHILAEIAGMGDAVDDRLMHRIGLHLQLELHMQRAGGDEGVDARASGLAQGLPGTVDVLAAGAGKPGDCQIAQILRHPAHGLEIAVSGDGKPAATTSPISSSTMAMRSFSSRFIEQPGACSPSRKVVSKMITRSPGRSPGVALVMAVALAGIGVIPRCRC
jgi:hypothetical protein